MIFSLIVTYFKLGYNTFQLQHVNCDNLFIMFLHIWTEHTFFGMQKCMLDFFSITNVMFLQLILMHSVVALRPDRPNFSVAVMKTKPVEDGN